MKSLIISVTLFFTNFANAQISPDSLSKYHVYKIISSVISNTQSTIFINFFNTKGRITKSVAKDKKAYFGSDSFIAFYYYDDTLLIKEIWRSYLKDKFVNGETIWYKYEKDNSGKQISKLTTEKTGKILKEGYRWNKLNLIDTIFYYSNDTMVTSKSSNLSIPSYCKTLKLVKVLINNWDANQQLYKTTECKVQSSWKNDSTLFQFVEFYKNADTSIQKITYWTADGGKVINYKKQFLISENEQYEESEQGDKSTIVYKKNNKGLVVEIRRKEQQIEGQFNSVNRLEYFFRK